MYFKNYKASWKAADVRKFWSVQSDSVATESDNWRLKQILDCQINNKKII